MRELLAVVAIVLFILAAFQAYIPKVRIALGWLGMAVLAYLLLY